MGADLWAVNDGMMDGYGPVIGSQPSGQINNREDLFFPAIFCKYYVDCLPFKGISVMFCIF